MRDLRSVDFNLLKALDALLDERNVTRAAARLEVSQPAMSGMLTRLRDSFDDPLFVRTQRGVVPTARAQSLAVPLKQVLGGIAELMEPYEFDPATAEFSFSLAASEYAQRALVLPYLVELKRQAPLLRVVVLPVQDGALPHRLERGEVDLALITLDKATPDLRARRLFDDKYVCVMRSGHPASKGPMTLDIFCTLAQITVTTCEQVLSDRVNAVLARQGLSRHVTLTLSAFSLLPELLRDTDFIAMAPQRLVENLPDLYRCRLPFEMPGFTQIMAWHERSHRDPAQRWLREQLINTCSPAVAGISLVG